MAKRGAKGKYNPEIIRTICNQIKLTGKAVDACRAAGISEETFYKWKKNYPEFIDELKKAVSVFKLTNLQVIRKASIKSWQAAAWLLERMFPDEFGLRNPIRQSEESSNDDVVKIYIPKNERESNGNDN